MGGIVKWYGIIIKLLFDMVKQSRMTFFDADALRELEVVCQTTCILVFFFFFLIKDRNSNLA